MRACFRPNYAAIEQAREILQISKPVKVYVRTYKNRSLFGRYCGERDGAHVISLPSDLRAATASRALWHELQHAAQAERLGGFEAFEATVKQEEKDFRVDGSRGSDRRYNRMPLERDANAAEKASRTLSLVVRI